MIEDIKKAVARLQCGERSGTAFMINENTALTVSHCILEAIEEDREITLTFYNVEGRDAFPVRAFRVPDENESPVSVLKLEKPVKTKYLELACYSDKLSRETKLLSYGYLSIEGEEGYPVDLCVNQYLNSNMPYDYDIAVLIDEKSRVKDYTGMSGSPVVYQNQVMGLLIEENIESAEDSWLAVDLKIISNNKARDFFENQGIPFLSTSFWEMRQIAKKSQVPREYQKSEYSFDNRQGNYQEGFVARSVAHGIAEEDYEDAVQRELERIFTDKNQGKWEMAWRGLVKLTEDVRSSKSRPGNTLAKLYYIRALWYLDDKSDMGSAQKYLRKALEYNPEYDCRTYQAKKYLLSGNIIEEKKVLLPLDNVSVLNTYLQACIFKKELEDAIAAYRTGEQFADHSTHYLMSLVYILDGEYEMAEDHLNKAEQTMKDAPLYIMMRGVIRYWKLLPPGMVYGDNLLPPMYFASMILPDSYMQREISDITKLYQRALTLVEVAENAELQKQILIVWLDTLSISEFYREEGRKVAEKLLKIDPYQCQGIIYLYMTGADLSAIDVEGAEKLLKSSGNQIEYVISYIYLSLVEKDGGKAYARLKKFRFKFEELHMMEYWYDLAARACHEKNEIQKLREELEKSSLDGNMKARVEGLLLESLQEYEELYRHAEQLYSRTGKEIDLVNLIHCCERIKKWDDAEKYCRVWDSEFENSMAKVHIIRCLAMQDRQEQCLKEIEALYKSGKAEYVTDEVCYLEAQAFKILGKYKEAIEKADKLWEKAPNQRTLFLLAECFFLIGEEQNAISTLKEGLKKGIRGVSVYQMLAEHERRLDVHEAAKYVKKACIVSDDAPEVMLWAMNFLFEIGESEKANELLLKLRALNQTDFVRYISFREAKEWMDRAEQESEQIFDSYKNCQFPYHAFIDAREGMSYALYCHQMWNYNREQGVKKLPLLVAFGGHRVKRDILEKSYGNEIVFDFSTLIHVKHLDILEEVKSCWKCIYLSGNINSVIAHEQKLCLPVQPDVSAAEKKMAEAWKKRKLNYLSRPDAEKVNRWKIPGVELGDIVPYETAKENRIFWISDQFLTDLMENSEQVPEEMRTEKVTIAELLGALELRGDISAELKMRYDDDTGREPRREAIEALADYKGKFPVLADNNFLQELYKLGAVSVISKKCDIYVFDNVFDRYEKKAKREEDGKTVIDFLEALKAEIAEGAEQGNICFFGHYRDDSIKDAGFYTGMLVDMMNFSVDRKWAVVCDDRWLNSFHYFEKSHIFDIVDIIELMHDKKILTDEKYIDVITQMLGEGYGYIVPPVTYMWLLILQTEDTGNAFNEIPEELLLVCSYLVNVTASRNKMMDEVIRPGVLPESVAFITHIQENLRYLLKEVWSVGRSNGWKQGISNWLLLNYSVFAYRSVMNKNDNEPSRDFFAMQLADFIFSGFFEVPAGYSRIQYYRWFFQWITLRTSAEAGLEERMFHWLAHIIAEVYRKARQTRYGIGIGALVMSATEDMPEYYAKKIRENTIILPIIEEFDGRFVILGGKEIITRSLFYKWLDDSMKSGLGQSIKRLMSKDSRREFEITWVANDLFNQGYQIRWAEEDGSEKRIYFRIEGAMLMSDDKILRMKGLYALNDYLDAGIMRIYETDINRPELQAQTVRKIIGEVKSSEPYLMHLIELIFEKTEYTLYTMDELLPEDTAYFEINAGDCMDAKQNMQLYQSWADKEETILASVYMELVVYICGCMSGQRNYQKRGENECLHWAFFYADKVLSQIVSIIQRGNTVYSLEGIHSFVRRENGRKNFSSLFVNRKHVADKKEKEMPEERAERFLKKEISEAAYEDVDRFCTQLSGAEPDIVSYAVPVLKRWIESQWKKEEKQNEIVLMQIMQRVALLEDRENAVACYMALWNDILDKNQKITVSMETVTMMRGLAIILGFEQGEIMMEIVERICLL